MWKESLKAGVIPGILTDAVISPIHKRGSKSDPRNYRCINLLSHLLKVFENNIEKSNSQLFRKQQPNE